MIPLYSWEIITYGSVSLFSPVLLFSPGVPLATSGPAIALWNRSKPAAYSCLLCSSSSAVASPAFISQCPDTCLYSKAGDSPHEG